jgi:hypothetical protein
VIIAKSGTPVAMLVPFDTGKRTPIKYGTLKGKIWIAENFHDPLPDDVLDAFARPTLKELLLADEPRAEIPFARRDDITGAFGEIRFQMIQVDALGGLIGGQRFITPRSRRRSRAPRALRRPRGWRI